MDGADGAHGGGHDSGGGHGHSAGDPFIGTAHGGHSGDIGHGDWGAHDAAHGQHGHGGKQIGAHTALMHVDHGACHGMHISHQHGPHAHPSQGGFDTDGLDGPRTVGAERLRIDPIVTWNEAVASGKTPTTTIMVHASAHDIVDMENSIRGIAREVGAFFHHRFIRVDKRLPNYDGFSDTKDKMMPWHGLVENVNMKNMPDIWRPRCNGTTKLARQYWQIGVWDPKLKRVVPNEPINTLLEIVWTVWRNTDINVFETKLSFRVVSVPVYVPDRGKYLVHVRNFDAHQKLAEIMAKKMYDVLRAARPSDAQLKLLELAGPSVFHHDEGRYPADRADEDELSNAKLETGTIPEGDNAPADDLPKKKDDKPAPGGTDGGEDAGSEPMFEPKSAVSGSDIATVLAVEKVQTASAPDVRPVNVRSRPPGTVPVTLSLPRFVVAR